VETEMNINETLRLHKAWINGEKGGKRADLQDANLRCADLRRANLTDADMRGADLRGADLTDEFCLIHAKFRRDPVQDRSSGR
jgi:uncharacterized protein YjbI with pentapeptide repeats